MVIGSAEVVELVSCIFLHQIAKGQAVNVFGALC
jgi:hypothetical protein